MPFFPGGWCVVALNSCPSGNPGLPPPFPFPFLTTSSSHPLPNFSFSCKQLKFLQCKYRRGSYCSSLPSLLQGMPPLPRVSSLITSLSLYLPPCKNKLPHPVVTTEPPALMSVFFFFFLNGYFWDETTSSYLALVCYVFLISLFLENNISAPGECLHSVQPCV